MPRHKFSVSEFVAVILIAFGWAIGYSILALLTGKTVGEPGAGNAFGNAHLYGVVLQEILLIPVVAFILHTCGWR